MIILKYKSEYIKHNEKWKLNSESIEKIKEIDYKFNHQEILRISFF